MFNRDDSEEVAARGPLSGIRVVELASYGPGPFCGMLLTDLGAEVIRVDRTSDVGGSWPPVDHVLRRGRRSIAVNLKDPDGVAVVMRLVAEADILIEGFRPGVTERLGVGPEDCHAVNPRLIYGRMTGWGQWGPMAHTAGHDINYIALSGSLEAIGPADGPPVPPLNYLGDFGGGAMFLALGVVSALWEARHSGNGQIVDASMVDGSALLAAMFHGARASGHWHDERGVNHLDGAAPYYGVYTCADGKFLALGAIEPKFYDELIVRLELEDAGLAEQLDESSWSRNKAAIAEVIKTKTRDEWCHLLEGTDACAAPVLSMTEAPEHPQNIARGTFIVCDGVTQPGPAPRFSRTRTSVAGPPARPGEHTDEVLSAYGFDPDVLRQLRRIGAIA